MRLFQKTFIFGRDSSRNAGKIKDWLPFLENTSKVDWHSISVSMLLFSFCLK